MKSAIKVYSPEKGCYFAESVNATDIKSHAHARKLAPFVDDADSRRMLYWVGWGAPKKNGKSRVAHFKHYPKNNHNLLDQISDEIELRNKESSESKKHQSAKDRVLEVLTELLLEGKHLPWAFKDQEISCFPMSGDFLAGAANIAKEFVIKTPFGNTYKLDIAILGKKISKYPIVLAGIEIEFTHKFDFLKTIICKSIGFPLISVNIEELEESSITKDWAKKALLETTKNSFDGLRRNYIYIHRFLTPIYLDIPREILEEARHQYVIFTKDQEKLLDNLRTLKDALKLSDKQVVISPVTNKNEQLRIQVENAGNLAGENWKEFNENSYIQLSLDKPCTKAGPLYYFHLTLSKLCNSIYDCLVGYKYELGHAHYRDAPLYWEKKRRAGEGYVTYRLAPKRVSEPVRKILDYVSEKHKS